jgi:hypothetical protein
MSNSKLIAIIGVLLLVVGVGAAYFLTDGFGTQNKKEDTDKETSASNERKENERKSEDSNSRTSNSGGSYEAVNPCNLFTAEDASKLLGKKMTVDMTDDLEACLYTSEDVSSFSVISLIVSSRNALSGGDLEAVLTKGTSFADIEQIIIKGADEALWINDIGQLHAIKGQYYIVVMIISDGNAKSVSQSLVQTVVNKL